MLFALLSVVRLASASDLASADGGVDTMPEPTVEHAGIPAPSSGSSSSSSSSSSSKSSSSSNSSSGEKTNSGVSDAEGKVFKSFKIGKWKVKPYVEPGGGVSLNSSTVSGVAGVDGGFKYSHKKWAGDLYIGGSGTVGDGTTGYEAHLGDDTGARFKYWGATLGLEGAYSGYVYATGASVKAAPSVSIPVKLVVGPKKYHLGVGVAPTFTGDKSRSVDWDKTKAIGFGDEFSWYVAGAYNVKQVSIKVKFTQTTMAGTDGSAIVTNTPTISLGVGDVISLAQ